MKTGNFENMEDHIVCKASEFSPNNTNTIIKPAGFGGSGFGTAVIQYNKSSINIRTHALVTPFGYSDGLYGNKKNPNVVVNLYQSRDEDKAFYDGIKQLEEILIQTAFDRRQEWRLFSNSMETKDATVEQVRAKLSPIVRESNGDYSPTFKGAFLKDYTSGEVKTPCYNQNNGFIEPCIETIPRRSKCLMDLQAKKVWISPEGKFGLKFEIQKIQVLPPDEQPTPRPVSFTPVSSVPISTPKLNLPQGNCCLLDSDDE